MNENQLIIKNVKTIDGQIIDHYVASSQNTIIDVQGKLTLLPALIDSNVHFRCPGEEHKENWITGARAAIAGGVTTVLDFPDNLPAIDTLDRLEKKILKIDEQLLQAKIPLRYRLFFGADQSHLEEINKARNLMVGLTVFMDNSSGDLLLESDESLERVFQIAAQENLILFINAEDREVIKENKSHFRGQGHYSIHSKIRDRHAAIKATERILELTQKYNSFVVIHNVNTYEGIDLIRQAKKSELLVHAEAALHHLFLTEDDYEKWGAKVLTNPPLRSLADQDALWEGIHDGTVDIIASGHAPHLIEEKNQPYGKAPAGIPGIEIMLPLLLNAFHEKKITLDKIVQLTRINVERIFRLLPTTDLVLVDLEKSQEVTDSKLKTKCRWSPYAGRILKGWPVYTILKGEVFS